MSSVVLRLVPVEADDGCLTDAERELCDELGTPALRRASRVAAKEAAAALLQPRVPYDDLSPLLLVRRGANGAPELAARTDLAQPLPAISMSHSAGWGAALAWLPEEPTRKDPRGPAMTLTSTAPVWSREPTGVLPDLPARRPVAPGSAGRPALRLAGRVALVSGAAGDLGTALVRRFAAEGAAVFATDLDADGSRWLAEQVSAEVPGCRVLGGGLDVTDPDAWTRAMRLARRHLGPVDVLVNNAGLIDLDRLDALDPAGWSRTVAVNQTAVMTGMRAALPTMWQAGGGAVVNVGSVFGLVGTGGSFAYHATKGALQAMTTAAAVELARRRIRVNAVLPGLIDTRMTAGLAPEFVAEYVAATPLARLARCADVAAAAVFLASDEADFVTGVCLPVDGGYTSR